jgi:hypothetical protein
MERIQLKKQNVRFLEMIRNTHSNWEQDRELSKIFKKMEKGKNLKKKEFAKVHWALWEEGYKFDENCLPNLKQELMEKSLLNSPTVDKSQDLAEECRKALEQSYGCSIPLPNSLEKKPKLKFSKNQNNRP